MTTFNGENDKKTWLKIESFWSNLLYHQYNFSKGFLDHEKKELHHLQ